MVVFSDLIRILSINLRFSIAFYSLNIYSSSLTVAAIAFQFLLLYEEDFLNSLWCLPKGGSLVCDTLYAWSEADGAIMLFGPVYTTSY